MEENLELKRKCLTLISRIAARAAGSPDPDHVADTLMELAYALETPHRDAERANSVGSFDRLYQELNYIDSTSQEFTAYHVLKYACRNTWN